MKVFHPDYSLHNYFSISSYHLTKDIIFLLEYEHSECNPILTMKLIGTLRRNGFHTVQDILNASPKRIQLMKGIGDRSFELLLELLRAISMDKVK